MANRWLWAGGAEAVRVVAGALDVGTTGFNATYADHTLKVNNVNRCRLDFTQSDGSADTVIAGEKLYFHSDIVLTDTSVSYTAANHIEFYDSSGFPWLAMRATAALTVSLFYNSGTGASPTWTTLGLAGTDIDFTRKTFDIWVQISAGGTHTAGYAVNGTQIGEANFTQASFTNVGSIELRSSSDKRRDYSQIMCSAGISLVGAYLFSSKPTGAGANTGFASGTYADIDDAGVNDADSIGSTAVGQRATYSYSNPPALTSTQALGDVFLWTRARNSGGSPTNVAPVRRTAAGVDTVGSNLTGISGAYKGLLKRYSGLTETEFNGSEFGVESAA